MARSWLIDSRGLARKVKGATQWPASQIQDCGANRECPKCHCRIDNSDVSNEWPGLPAGVKFDPSDVQLLDHLAAKCGVVNAKPHKFIDEFIPTLKEDQGICYTHPKNFPGARKDGNSVHFFHRAINAYATGRRKRRRIHSEEGESEEQVRWHKTGKTKPVIYNGIQKGCKKIMVLYKSSKKGTKPDKCNWVMHQYHIGTEEEEKDGDFVVCKIFYQHPKPNDKNNIDLSADFSRGMIQSSPRTPKITTPNPPQLGKLSYSDDAIDDVIEETESAIEEWLAGHESQQAVVKLDQNGVDASHESQANVKLDQNGVDAGHESQAAVKLDQNGVDDFLLCNENFDSHAPLGDTGLNYGPLGGFDPTSRKRFLGADGVPTCGVHELEDLELGTPLDFELADLQFGSQDSIFSWLDRL